MAETISSVSSKVFALETKVNEMDKNVSIFSEILKRFDESINKLSCSIDKIDSTMDSIKTSMTDMQFEIKTSNREIADLKIKVDTITDNATINWMRIIKNNFIAILIGGGIASGLLKLLGVY